MTAPKPCLEVVTPECQYPRSKRSTKWCVWHWLKRQPPGTQTEYAAWRLRRAQKSEGFQFRPRVPESQWPEGERWCSGCQSFVPMFYTSGSRCRACASKAAHEARVTDQYGLGLGEYDELLIAQDRRCAICRGRPISVRLAVDHDHVEGEVRGLLCSRCNHDLLGSAHDSPRLLVRALAYLQAPPHKDPAAWKARYEELCRLLGIEYAPLEQVDPFSTSRGGITREQAGSPF